MPLTDEMKKSIEEIVDQTFSKLKDEEVKKSEEEEKEDEKTEEETTEKSETETDGEDIEKGKGKPDEKTPQNGGKDTMKNGSPYTEKQGGMKKSEEEEKEGEESEEEETSEEETTEKSKKDESPKMKKSLEELAEHLDSDELELIQAWREENTEEVAKSQSGLQDTSDLASIVKGAVAEATQDLKKAMSDKDDMIKSLQDKVEKMESRPAYDKRSVDSLEPIEKSGEGNGTEQISKAKVLDTMLDLQKSGKGISSYHVAEFEATGTISNPQARQTVMDALKKA